MGAARGDFHHCATQGPGDRAILALGVDDDNIIIGSQGHIFNRRLHSHRFAGAGNAQVKGMGRNEPLAFTNQQVLGNGVDTIRQAAGVLDFLDPEGHKYGGALGGQRAQGLHPAQAIGQNRVQPVLLLIAQGGKLAKVLPANRKQCLGVRVQLLQAVRNMDQCNHSENHPLISLREVGEKFLGLSPELFQLIGNGCGKVVLVVLPLLPACNIRLNAQDTALYLPHGLIGGNGQNINREHEVSREVGQVGNHLIFDVTGIVLQKQHPAHLVTHLKVSGLEGKSIRANEVPEVEPTADGRCLVKGKILLLSGPEKVMEDTEPVVGGKRLGPGVQPSKALGQIGVHPPEIGSGLLDFPLRYGKGDVFLLNQIVAFGGPSGQDLIGFPTIAVQLVPALFHQDLPLEVHRIDPAIDDGDFCGGVSRQGVEHRAVGKENGPALLL